MVSSRGALAQQLAHPWSLAVSLYWTAMLHHLRREAPLTQARAEVLRTIATAQRFLELSAHAMPLLGWARAASWYGGEDITQLQQGLAAYQATGAARDRPYYLAILAEVSAQSGQTAAGLEVLAEALAKLGKSQAQWREAEMHRLRGELLLQYVAAQPGEAEACFKQALTVTRRQQAKSLKLRAAMTLTRLWQYQEAYRSLPAAGGGIWVLH